MPKPFIFYTKGLETKSFYDEKAKRERYFVKGHIDSSDLDLVNDIVTKDCMKDLESQLKSRNIKLDFDHETLRKGMGETELDERLNLTKVPLGKALSQRLDDKGNFVEFELNPNWKKFNSKGDVVMTFNELWDNVKSGYYDAFSIAYIPLETDYRQMGEKKARLLNKVNLVNVALTGNPINPMATISSVMAKSLEFLKNREDDTMNEKEMNELKSKHSELEKQNSELKSQVEKLTNEKSKLEEEKEDENEKKSEEKSVEQKAVAELKSEVVDLKSKVEEINKVLEKAMPKSKGPEDKSIKENQSEVKSDSNTMDLI